MGYTTDFSGSWEVTPALTPEQVAYINAFNDTRRMARDVAVAGAIPDLVREAVGLPIGPDAAFFVAKDVDERLGVTDYNRPPKGQPGLWCQWCASSDGAEIQWDGGEKFYDYIDWIEYLVQAFFEPWGRKLNGQVTWSGEDSDDLGMIRIVDNKVRVLHGIIEYVEGPWR